MANKRVQATLYSAPDPRRSAGARDASAAELLNGAVIRLRWRSAGLRCASPHGGASKPAASPPLRGAAHLAPISQPEYNLMESAMKNTILRILISAILFSLISGIVVSIIGLMLGWKTSTQFSNGFFWAGVIMISIGFISFQGYRQRTIDWPPVHSDPAERSNLWAADTFRGKNLVAVFGISGLLLFGLSFLILRLF